MQCNLFVESSLVLVLSWSLCVLLPVQQQRHITEKKEIPPLSMKNRTTLPARVSALLWLFVHFIGLLSLSPLCTTALVDVHIANLTVRAAGWLEKEEALALLTNAVTLAACQPLANIQLSKGSCKGFILPDSEDEFSVMVYAETRTTRDSTATNLMFDSWVQENSTAMLTDITAAAKAATGRNLSVPEKVKGMYTLLCRGKSLNEVSSSFQTPKDERTSIIVHNMPDNMFSVLCENVPIPCDTYIATEVVSDTQKRFSISGVANTLGVALKFVDVVRKNSKYNMRIELVSNGRTAQLYAFDEMNVYGRPLKIVLVCDATNGIWLVSLIPIFFGLLISLRYVWYKGRQRAKKAERRAIIEDELRLQHQMEQQNMVEMQDDKWRIVRTATETPQEYVQGSEQYQNGYDQTGYPREYYSVPQDQLQEYVGYTQSEYPQDYIAGAATTYDENALGEYGSEIPEENIRWNGNSGTGERPVS